MAATRRRAPPASASTSPRRASSSASAHGRAARPTSRSPPTSGRPARAAALRPPHLLRRRRPASGKTTSVLRAAAGRAAEGRLARCSSSTRRATRRRTRVPARLAAATGRAVHPLRPARRATAITGSRCGASGPPRSSPGSSPASRRASPTTPTRCASTSASSRSVLHAAGYWPPSLPAARRGLPARPVRSRRRARPTRTRTRTRTCGGASDHQAKFVASKEGEKALGGGLVRLDLVMGEAWRSVLTPRTDSRRRARSASTSPQAIRERAVVLWRTHVDQMPDEAQDDHRGHPQRHPGLRRRSPGRRARAVDVRARRVRRRHRDRRRARRSRCCSAAAPTKARCTSSRSRSADIEALTGTDRAAGVDGRQLRRRSSCTARPPPSRATGRRS